MVKNYIIKISIDAESITEKELENLAERLLYVAEKPDRKGFVVAEVSEEESEE